MSLAGRAVLQMDQTESENQNILRYIAERGEDSGLDRHQRLRACGHRSEVAQTEKSPGEILQILTLPTKVPSASLGRIGSLKRTSDKSLFPMALGSCGHRITHQLRLINMNRRSILSVTSILSITLCEKTPIFTVLSGQSTGTDDSPCCNQLPLFDF